MSKFYLHRKLTTQETLSVVRDLGNGKYDKVRKILNDITIPIHICDIEDGKPVIFDHNNGKYYQLNRKSIGVFLDKRRGVIKDDNDNIYTGIEFWRLVDSHNSNYLDWEDDTIVDKWFKDELRNIKDKFNININSFRFKSDSLVFSILTT